MSRSKQKLADGASIAEHARRLKQRAGWDPVGQRETSEQALARQLGTLRVDQATDDALGCADCARARSEQQDLGALCRAHLAQAMGLSGEA